MALKLDKSYTNDRAMLYMDGTYIDITTHETFHVRIVHSDFVAHDYSTPGFLCGDWYCNSMEGYRKGYETRKTIQN